MESKHHNNPPPPPPKQPTKPILIVKCSIRLSKGNIEAIKQHLKHLDNDYYVLIFDEFLDAQVITDAVLADKLRKYCIDDIKDLEI